MTSEAVLPPPGRTQDRPRLATLDALRALAVVGVLAVHFSDSAKAMADWGALGVRLFFVLSGFLITGLLLEARKRIESGRSGFRAELRGFFLRRFLRIGPAYYAAVLGAIALNIPYARESALWHVLFLSNYYVLLLGRWPDLLSHFWTLGLEFQFYLFWPFAILALGRRGRLAAVAAMLVIGPLARWSAPWFGISGEFCGLPFPGCLDIFGWGAAVALWRDGGPAAAAPFELACRRFLPVGLIATAFLASAPPANWSESTNGAVAAAIMAATFAMLVARATATQPPAWSRLLGKCRPLVYLGTISYGIYLYHNFMHWVAPRLNLRLFGKPYLENELPHVVVLVVLTLFVSMLSWHLWERPFLRRQAPRAQAHP